MKNFVLFCLVFPAALSSAAQTHLTVAKDNSGEYKTIQEAIDAVPNPNNKPVIIELKPGIYKGKVTIDSGKNFITLKAQPGSKTTIVFANHEGSVLFNGKTLNISDCATFSIFANDFRAENIHFRNEAGAYAGPAVAVRAQGSRLSFFNCLITGYQSTLFLSGSAAKHFFYNCYIEGSSNFIFGSANAVFQKCRLHSKRSGAITLASTSAFAPYGFVFIDCNLTAEERTLKVFLGRAGGAYANVAYISCQMEEHIYPQGWDNGKKPENEATVRFSEYNSTGPGANNSLRVKWSRQLTKDEQAKFSIKNIFGNWKPV